MYLVFEQADSMSGYYPLDDIAEEVVNENGELTDARIAAKQVPATSTHHHHQLLHYDVDVYEHDDSADVYYDDDVIYYDESGLVDPEAHMFEVHVVGDAQMTQQHVDYTDESGDELLDSYDLHQGHVDCDESHVTYYYTDRDAQVDNGLVEATGKHAANWFSPRYGQEPVNVSVADLLSFVLQKA